MIKNNNDPKSIESYYTNGELEAIKHHVLSYQPSRLQLDFEHIQKILKSQQHDS